MATTRYGLAALLIVGAFAPSRTASCPPKEEADDDKACWAMKQLELAHQVAAFGRQHKAQEAVLAAGSVLWMMRDVHLSALDVQPRLEGTDEKSTEVPRISFNDQANALFAEAARLAVENKQPDITAVIDDIRTLRTRCAFPGPRVAGRTLPGKQTHVYQLSFDAGKGIVVFVSAATPVHVTAVRTDNDTTLVDRRGTWFLVELPPSDKGKDGQIPLSIRIENKAKERGSYQLYTR